jgi:hypothetical protein
LAAAETANKPLYETLWNRWRDWRYRGKRLAGGRGCHKSGVLSFKRVFILLLRLRVGLIVPSV